MNFDSFSFDPRIAAGIKALGYTTPTPIQQKAIPHVVHGGDVMGLAQTGTGKTAAFGLPILQRLLAGPRGVVRALVVAPTRELAEQIYTHITQMGAKTGIRAIAIYGGVNINPQIQRIRAGVEIVVACPGRLLDHVEHRTIDLSRVEVLVIDEADRMFDMGFLPDIRRIVKAIPAQRQTLMFSATMPEDIRKLAHDVLHSPITVQVGHAAPAETVSHALYPVPQHLKTALLSTILKTLDAGSVLVFTRTKHRAKRVGQQLEKAGFDATSLQGNLSQNRRQAALDGFRSGKHQIMVATDIAARGIDVSTISHVINYDMPDTADAYTHRIGRTGRAAKTGDAFTFVAGEDEQMVRVIERVLGERLPRKTVEGFDYRAAAPNRDVEFARGPRPSRGPQKPKQHSGGGDHRGGSHGGGQRQGAHGGGGRGDSRGPSAGGGQHRPSDRNRQGSGGERDGNRPPERQTSERDGNRIPDPPAADRDGNRATDYPPDNRGGGQQRPRHPGSPAPRVHSFRNRTR